MSLLPSPPPWKRPAELSVVFVLRLTEFTVCLESQPLPPLHLITLLHVSREARAVGVPKALFVAVMRGRGVETTVGNECEQPMCELF